VRVLVLAIGSRGDVQPYVALGKGLRQVGHEVFLATSDEFVTLVESNGLRFRRLSTNPRALIEGEAGLAWLESGRNPVAFVRRLARLVEPLWEQFLDDCWRVCAGAEAIIFSPLGFPAWEIAEKLKIPSASAALQPGTRTFAFPSPLVTPGFSLGGIYNWLTYLLVEQLMWQPFRGVLSRWRRDVLELEPLPFLGPAVRFNSQHVPLIYGYSPSVIPRPSDYPDWVKVTGYWFLDQAAEWQPPAGLVDFLNAGPPPVYLGFGSMTTRKRDELSALVVDALRQAGQRGILLTGWAGLGDSALTDDVYQIDYAPHDWLFPRVSAVVHHGGAGTTAAGLRAGVPSLVAPFFADQPFWGQRVAALGVGPAPIPQKNLTTDRLARAIRQATSDEKMRVRSAALGARIRSEDGVARAVEVLQEYLR